MFHIALNCSLCSAHTMRNTDNYSRPFMYSVITLCVLLFPTVYCFTVCSAVLHAVVVGLLAGSQYPEGPALTGHLGTCVSLFPCV
jgi:hypothetical protein